MLKKKQFWVFHSFFAVCSDFFNTLLILLIYINVYCLFYRITFEELYLLRKCMCGVLLLYVKYIIQNKENRLNV